MWSCSTALMLRQNMRVWLKLSAYDAGTDRVFSRPPP